MEQVTLIEEHTAHCIAYVRNLRITKDQQTIDIAISALEELGIEIPRELTLMDNHWG
jgi:hypothetical protein